MFQEGDNAPDFVVKNQNGDDVKLSDFRGSKVVLYFYPRDNTPGCTKEACSLRDGFSTFEEKGIKILGVSTDDEKSPPKIYLEIRIAVYAFSRHRSRGCRRLRQLRREKVYGETV